MDKKFLAFITLTLIVVIGCSMGIRARGQENRFTDITNDYYKSIEQNYVESVRSRLDENGFRNAGISLTKTLEADGSMEYELAIHHRRIDKMSQYQRDQLSDIIVSDGIDVACSSVSVRYIEY